MSTMITDFEPRACNSADRLATFVEVAKKHRAKLLLLAQRMTLRREEAEDVVQEALLKAFRALPRFRGDSRMDTWLHAIVRNSALDYLRNRKGRVELPLEPFQADHNNMPILEFVDPGRTPEQSYEHIELERMLDSAMNDVTSLNRIAMRMCVLEELPHRLVANNLRVSVATLKSRVFHGKRMLREAVSRRTFRREG
jgi:RNA polymerase sigma-70 factor, ECF subfamily